MHVRLRQSESEVKVIWLSVSVLNFYLCPSRLFFLRLWGTNSDLHPDSKISAQFPGADVRSFQDFERFNDCYWAYRNFDESKVWFSPGWPMWWRQWARWLSIILSVVPSFFKPRQKETSKTKKSRKIYGTRLYNHCDSSLGRGKGTHADERIQKQVICQ